MQRRSFLGAMGGALALAACSRRAPFDGEAGVQDARLAARPGSPTLTLAPGFTRDKVGSDTYFVAYLPESAVGLASVPLLVFLHGANRTVEPFMTAFSPLAEQARVMLLMPYADYGTWDGINGPIRHDRIGIDATLQWVFSRVPVAPSRVWMSGFSDGATFALAMGRANGDLFSKVLAFAPGFVLPIVPVGTPPILIAHGTQDTILSFAYSRDVIRPAMMQAGHEVDFREFVGPHAVPGAVFTEQLGVLGNQRGAAP